MKGSTTTYRVINSQSDLANEVKKLFNDGLSYVDIVSIYLPEYLVDDGCSLLVEDVADLKKKSWSATFDVVIRLPDAYVDELFTILYTLDCKENKREIESPPNEAELIKILANTIKSIERSSLPKRQKANLIKDVALLKLT